VLAAIAATCVLACTQGPPTDEQETTGVVRSAVGPPGDNGTIKIQQHTGFIDDIPDNDPHVGCIFDIEFRNYDEGDLYADWTLSVQPPSGKFVPIRNDTVFIGEDPAGGATDLDAVVIVDLSQTDLSPFFQNPQQGFHLKLDIAADGSIGNDKKSKVFWVTGCGGKPPCNSPP
jgi:hypothetical protein